MNAVISIALPVFAIIAAGLAAGRFRLMTGGDSQSLNKFVFRFAMPAALFGLTASASPPSSDDLWLAGSYGAASLITIFAAYFIARPLFALTKSESGAHALSSTLGNAVFLGLPIALSIDGWARPYVMLMLVEGVIIIAIGAAMMSPRNSTAKGFMKIAGYFSGPVKNPLVVGMAAGFIYSSLGLGFTGPVQSAFSILGRAAGPVALFSLGLFLATHQFPKLNAVAGRVAAIGAAKLLFLPFIALSAASMLGVSDPDYVGALALFVFVPTGIGSFVMASQYKTYETESAAAVSLTTLFSVFTISAVLYLFA